jgi:hypothetical protein
MQNSSDILREFFTDLVLEMKKKQNPMTKQKRQNGNQDFDFGRELQCCFLAILQFPKRKPNRRMESVD